MQELFGAGSESAFTTLEWAVSELIKNPKAMQRATAEVRRAFAAGGTVVEERLGEVPYLHLVMRETLRLHPPVPMLIPRESREACQVLGYDVPQGTQVLVNVWALGRDERYWDAPEEFRPERFEHEAAAMDFRGADFELLPFGGGRRICPGMAFGTAIVEYALASLMLHFDWELDQPGPGVLDPAQLDMTETFGLTARRKANLWLRPVLRVPIPGV
jgi:cytochrome P450